MYEHNIYELPWLTLINYTSSTTMPEEIVVVTDKINALLCDEAGPAKVSLALEYGVRFDRARPEMLVALVRATYPFKADISNYKALLTSVTKELDSRGLSLNFMIFDI